MASKTKPNLAVSPTLGSNALDPQQVLSPEVLTLELKINTIAAQTVAQIDAFREDKAVTAGERRRLQLETAGVGHTQSLDVISKINVQLVKAEAKTHAAILECVRQSAPADGMTVAEARRILLERMGQCRDTSARMVLFGQVVEERDARLGEAALQMSASAMGVTVRERNILLGRVRHGFAPVESQRLAAISEAFARLDVKLQSVNSSFALDAAQIGELTKLQAAAERRRKHSAKR